LGFPVKLKEPSIVINFHVQLGPLRLSFERTYMQVIQLPRVTSRNLSAFSLGFSFYIIYKVDELGFKELLALIHEMVKFLLFLLKNLLLRTHHIRDLVLDITGLNEL